MTDMIFTAKEVESMMQECAFKSVAKVLNVIRAEINAIEISGQVDEHTLFARSADGVKDMVLEIIDRYRNEVSE